MIASAPALAPGERNLVWQLTPYVWAISIGGDVRTILRRAHLFF